MATVQFKQGTSSALDTKAIEDGVIYFITDTQELAVDINGERIYFSKKEGEGNLPSDIEDLIIVSAEKPESNICKLWVEI